MNIIRVAIMSLSLAPAALRALEPTIANSSARTSSAEFQDIKVLTEALAQAERSAAEFHRLSAEAKRAKSCRAGLRAESALKSKDDSMVTIGSFVANPDLIVSYQACKAVAARSVARCDALSSFSFGATPRPGEVVSPRSECRQNAAKSLIVRAMILNEGASRCAELTDAIHGLSPDRRIPVCTALLSAAPARACEKVAAASGESDAKSDGECRAKIALRDAKSEKVCSTPNLPKKWAEACHEIFSPSGACVALAGKIIDEHCLPTTTRQNMIRKYEEVEAILQRVGPALDSWEPRSDPKRTALLARVRRIGAGMEAAVPRSSPARPDK